MAKNASGETSVGATVGIQVEDDGDGKGVVGRGGRESRSECGQINRRPQRLAVGGKEKMGSRTIPRFPV